MLLASFNSLWPVTGVFLFVVEESTDTELFNGRSVPASPVADARRLMTEDTVLPVTNSSSLRRICKFQYFN